MSVCILGKTDNDELRASFIEDGYQQYDGSYNLIGTFNIRWYPTTDDGSVGGVCRVDTVTNTAARAGWRGEPDGDEFLLPKTFFWTELSEHQKNAFIKPSAPRSRPDPPPSLCAPIAEKATNYPITDPEHSFLPRDSLKDTQLYFVHDNGSRPFKVLAHQNAVEVYTDADELVWDEKRIYNDRIGCYTEFLGIWPGYDSADYSQFTEPEKRRRTRRVRRVKRRVPKRVKVDTTTDKNDENDACLVRHCCRSEYGQIHRANGNSILIQLTPTSYVHVGCEVYTFETDEPIMNYFSPLGNNDVPYPVAYSANNVYFMLDHCYISKDQLLTPLTAAGSDDMYREFYGHVHPQRPAMTTHKMKNVNVIRERN